jgi:ATP-binding cassette subfamily G (WHITE) protein 2 (SNQ2)
VLAVGTVLLPLQIVECMIFSSILYWMSAFAADGGRFIFFSIVLLLVDIFFSQVFRAVAYKAPSIDVAQQIGGPITSISLLFGGFLVTKAQIPDYLKEIYWVSPFSWALRSLANNEFEASDYNIEVRTGPPPAPFLRDGDVIMS